MLAMVSHPRRPQSGHITCYLNRTYHVLPTTFSEGLVKGLAFVLETAAEHKFNKAAHQYFDLYAMVFPYSVELSGLTKEEQTNSANDTVTPQSSEPVSQPDVPAVTVSKQIG